MRLASGRVAVVAFAELCVAEFGGPAVLTVVASGLVAAELISVWSVTDLVAKGEGRRAFEVRHRVFRVDAR